MSLDCYEYPLNQPILQADRPALAVRLRSFRGIVMVHISDAQIVLRCKPGISVQAAYRYIRMTEKQMSRQHVLSEQTMKAYKREAIISIAGFAAMQIMKKAAPQIFYGTKVIRSLFVVYIARNFIENGVTCLWREHEANADTLTATAVLASVFGGKPESSLTLLALSNGAEMLTTYAAERARQNITKYLSLNQQDAWLVEDGKEQKVPVETLQAGCLIAAHLGEKICVDGRVLKGKAAVNQASVTGESTPVIKEKGSAIYAGSVIEAGNLVISVEKVGKDTSLAHVIHLVEEAQTRKAPVQNYADRIANMLVPVSFLGAAVVYGATRDWQRVLNLLFIDFSCGLKLSTATAISSAIGIAARRGILVKGGNYIEELSNVDTVVLDKTGTITMGIPQISALKVAPGIEEKEMILLAASAELHSVHPLAVAIQRYVKAKKWGVPQHTESHTVVARGMQAVVPDFEGYVGGSVIVGSRRFMQENNVSGLQLLAGLAPDENAVCVARDNILLGTISIHDPIRPQMKKSLNQMRRLGVDEVVMLTGDSQEVARVVAHEMDIDSYHAEILPEDKASYIMRLKQHGHVMMVGDGINDAPALAFSNVGVTLGGRQTDLAAESSAVTIRSEEPVRLVDTLRLAQETMEIINQNFMATIIVNSGAMLLGALGKITPLWAAVIHNTATLVVVMNSVRILRK